MTTDRRTDWLNERSNCYVEFKYDDPQRFKAFHRFFRAMRGWTRRSSHLAFYHDEHDSLWVVRASGDDNSGQRLRHTEDWLRVLTAEDRDLLGLPPLPEARRYLALWDAILPDEAEFEAHTDPQLRRLWEFDNMLGFFDFVAYELTACEIVGPNTARLEYAAFDFPYGGKLALEEVMLFFGFWRVIAQSD